MPSTSETSHEFNDADTNGLPRRLATRVQRPTDLFTDRNRSESPATRSKSRPKDLILIQNCFTDGNDLSSLEHDIAKRSGVLNYKDHTYYAKMDDFINEGLLGSGTCGIVLKMRHRSYHHLVMAVKQMRRSSTSPEENKRIMSDLHSDVWICMEIMSTCLHKLLNDLHRPFPEKVVGKIAVSITTALDYLKSEYNVMHRDVKPSNMLLSYEGVVKLCDFGISGQLKESIARSRQLGCVGYMAPERLSKSTYDVRADIWSLGISLIELATGCFPYSETQTEFAVMTKIISDPAPTLPYHIEFTSAFRQFVESCLTKDHTCRPKYQRLMTTDYFCLYNKDPYDIFDWIKKLPLSYLHSSSTEDMDLNNYCKTKKSNFLSPSNPASSPDSVATLSPDASKDMTQEFLKESDVHEVGEKLSDAHLTNSSNDELNSSGELNGTYSRRDGFKSIVDYFEAARLERNKHSTENLFGTCLRSFGSNGYLPSSDTSFFNRNVVRAPPLPVPNRTKVLLEAHRLNNQSNLKGTNSPKLSLPDGQTMDNQNNTLFYPDGPISKSHCPSLDVFSPDRKLIYSNRNGNFHDDATAKCKPRDSSIPSNRTPSHRNNESRSSSVGAQLQRSPAQRWPTKPSFVLKGCSTINGNGRSVKSSNECATNRSCRESSTPPSSKLIHQCLSPQQYHHHYFHYYYDNHPHERELRFNASGSPVLPQSKTSLPTYYDEKPITIPGNLLGRMGQRLHTHPIPRQTSFQRPPLNTRYSPSNILPHPMNIQHLSKCSSPNATFKAVNERRSSPSPLLPSHRSLSQPIKLGEEGLAFETRF